MRRGLNARQAGISKTAIKTALGRNLDEKAIMDLLYGDINALVENKFGSGEGKQYWATLGKRYVQVNEARFASEFFLRNNLPLQSHTGLILTGADPQRACLPWAMFGLAERFIGYEIDWKTMYKARYLIPETERRIKEAISHIRSDGEAVSKNLELAILEGDCLDDPGSFTRRGKLIEMAPYSVMDLDFCNNQLRFEKQQERIIDLIKRNSPDEGLFILRTTLHVGRIGNSKKEIEKQIIKFEDRLRKASFREKAKNRNQYQSNLPMLSLIWILEKEKKDENTDTVEQGNPSTNSPVCMDE